MPTAAIASPHSQIDAILSEPDADGKFLFHQGDRVFEGKLDGDLLAYERVSYLGREYLQGIYLDSVDLSLFPQSYLDGRLDALLFGGDRIPLADRGELRCDRIKRGRPKKLKCKPGFEQVGAVCKPKSNKSKPESGFANKKWLAAGVIAAGVGALGIAGLAAAGGNAGKKSSSSSSGEPKQPSEPKEPKEPEIQEFQQRQAPVSKQGHPIYITPEQPQEEEYQKFENHEATKEDLTNVAEFIVERERLENNRDIPVEQMEKTLEGMVGGSMGGRTKRNLYWIARNYMAPDYKLEKTAEFLEQRKKTRNQQQSSQSNSNTDSFLRDSWTDGLLDGMSFNCDRLKMKRPKKLKCKPGFEQVGAVCKPKSKGKKSKKQQGLSPQRQGLVGLGIAASLASTAVTAAAIHQEMQRQQAVEDYRKQNRKQWEQEEQEFWKQEEASGGDYERSAGKDYGGSKDWEQTWENYKKWREKNSKDWEQTWENYKKWREKKYGYGGDYGYGAGTGGASPSSSPGINWTEELGVNESASTKDIKAAYKKAVKQHHPDLVQDPEEKKKREEKMKQINLAYEAAMKGRTDSFLWDSWMEGLLDGMSFKCDRIKTRRPKKLKCKPGFEQVGAVCKPKSGSAKDWLAAGAIAGAGALGVAGLAVGLQQLNRKTQSPSKVQELDPPKGDRKMRIKTVNSEGVEVEEEIDFEEYKKRFREGVEGGGEKQPKKPQPKPKPTDEDPWGYGNTRATMGGDVNLVPVPGFESPDDFSDPWGQPPKKRTKRKTRQQLGIQSPESSASMQQQEPYAPVESKKKKRKSLRDLGLSKGDSLSDDYVRDLGLAEGLTFGLLPRSDRRSSRLKCKPGYYQAGAVCRKETGGDRFLKNFSRAALIAGTGATLATLGLKVRRHLKERKNLKEAKQYTEKFRQQEDSDLELRSDRRRPGKLKCKPGYEQRGEERKKKRGG